MKKCRKCGNEKVNGRCRTCANATQRKWVAKHKAQHLAICKKWRDEHREVRRSQKARWAISLPGRIRLRAIWTAHNALRRGDLVKSETCTICGKPVPLEMHHQDYSKPLEVDWLCQFCHGAVRAAANEIVRIAVANNAVAVAF